MRVLIVEDDHKIANSIKKGFQQENISCDVVYDGADGFDLASSESYDVLVLDIMLPGLDGLTICKKLREEKNYTPILMLTAKSEISDKVEGLNSGADDYLAKPFSFDELVARVRALSRRPRKALDTTLTIADLKLNPTTFEVSRGGKKIDLSKKEFAMLEYLLRNKESIVSKSKIIAHVWEYDAEILPNTVEVFIGYLRQKVDRDFKGKPELIKTVRGFGYKVSNKERQ